jgi:hypothetical protein
MHSGDSQVRTSAPDCGEHRRLRLHPHTPSEVAAIDALDTGVRGGPDPDLIDPERRQFKVEN